MEAWVSGQDSPSGSAGSPFDDLAMAWDDDPQRGERARKVASAIKQRTTPGGHWLDYGAGTGVLGLALLGHADRVSLADSSAGMLEVSRAKVAAAGLDDRVRTVQLDLETQEAAPDRYHGVASLQALHHIDDVGRAIARLAAMLRPGGWLALADLDAEDGSFHTGHHGVRPAHHGFRRDQLRTWMTSAGLVDIDFSTPVVLHKNDRDYSIFLVVGRRPPVASPAPAVRAPRSGDAGLPRNDRQRSGG